MDNCNFIIIEKIDEKDFFIRLLKSFTNLLHN